MRAIAVFLVLSRAGTLLLHADTGWEGATRVEDGRSIKTSQVQVATAAASNATVLISATATRPCVKIKNLSALFQVAIGSHTGVTPSDGFLLSVSTHAATAKVELHNFTGGLWGKGEGALAGPNPSVGILECNSAP